MVTTFCYHKRWSSKSGKQNVRNDKECQEEAKIIIVLVMFFSEIYLFLNLQGHYSLETRRALRPLAQNDYHPENFHPHVVKEHERRSEKYEAKKAWFSV